MLLSMTGFGEAREQGEQLGVAVEVRSLNNRYLKVTTKCPELYSLLEPEVERLVRARIHRGTVQVQIRIDRQHRPEDFRLNPVAIESYLKQLQALRERLGLNGAIPIEQVLLLPGAVLEEPLEGWDPMDDWPAVRRTLEQALDRLQTMRVDEGRAMRQELLATRNVVAQHLDAVAARAPQVVESYRDKLHERVQALLAQLNLELDRHELIREVSIFAERSDIAEEIVRLRSHLDQFQEIIEEKQSAGRKLDFLTQEMFREANMIGSKANDVEIARRGVEIKGAIERIRELIQNVE